jgi:broad specificity phosphatase PhoE
MVLLRHGETEWSQSGQHTGRTDIPLLVEGEDQAKAAGAVLRDHGFTTFSQVLMSPLIRAKDTCALAGFGAHAVADADLMEWDYGDYEGLTSAQIQEGHPGWSLWEDGVPGGERAADVGRRADRIVARARGLDGDTLCVAHGHFLRVLAARWLGLPPVAGRLFLLGPGGIGILGWERAWPALEAWNLGAAPTRGSGVEE